VAKFVFDEKTQSYSEQSDKGTSNCGVIGCKVYNKALSLGSHKIDNDFWKNPFGVKPYELGDTYTGTPNPIWYYSSTGLSADYCKTDNITFTCSSDNQLSSDLDNKISACNMDIQKSAKVPDFNMGTAWGGAKEDKISEGSFEKGSLAATMEIYYSDRKSLEAIGISFDKNIKVEKAFPQAFNGFCKPPSKK
jgi:hypothetical protein